MNNIFDLVVILKLCFHRMCVRFVNIKKILSVNSLLNCDNLLFLRTSFFGKPTEPLHVRSMVSNCNVLLLYVLVFFVSIPLLTLEREEEFVGCANLQYSCFMSPPSWQSLVFYDKI